MSIEAFVRLVVTVSVAAERLVEITKGLWPFLREENADPAREHFRTTALQALAVVFGVVTALLAGPAIGASLPEQWDIHTKTLALFGIGLLASGGSGFWNAILSYLHQLKELKKMQASEAKLAPIARQRRLGTEQARI